MTNYTATSTRPIHRIAAEIFEECIRLRVAASDYLAAYLGPLLRITDLNEDFGYDSAVGIAAYCLDALADQPGWTGAAAERLTLELRDRVAEIYGQDFDDPGLD